MHITQYSNAVRQIGLLCAFTNRVIADKENSYNTFVTMHLYMRLALGWVTVFGFNSWYQTFISVCNHPLRPTQPFVLSGSVNEDQLHLGRTRQVWFIPLADERGVCR